MRTQQQQQHAHVVQLLLDVSKLGNVEIANPDRLRWWRRRHVGHTVTLPLSFPPKPCQSLKIWACLSACRSDLPFSPFCCLFVSVAMFHASFHPTQGNVVDWSLKASHGPFQTHTYIYRYIHIALDLSLDHLEFSALPSGLHLVEQDVVCVLSWCFSSCVCSQISHRYFTKDGQHGVCIFQRRKTAEKGHRGFRLSSLGILLARSRRPRPWRHVPALKELTRSIYAKIESTPQLQPTGRDWDPAQAFFAARKITRPDLGGAGDWNGWIDELEIVRTLCPLLGAIL